MLKPSFWPILAMTSFSMSAKAHWFTVAIISEAVRSSGETVLRQLVLISASLGIMNLLPIPAMDGGRLVFMLIEVVRGKPISQEKEGMIHFIGLLLLFGLIIFLTFNDVTNLLNGTFK